MNKNIYSFLKRPDFIISINWAHILFYLTFLCYGYFGSLTFPVLKDNIIITLILMFVQALYGYIAWKYSDRFNDVITIPRRDVLVFLFFLIFFIFINFQNLSFSLIGDQLAYVQSSLRHSFIFGLKIISYTNFFDDIPFRFLLQIINFVILFMLFLFYSITRKSNWLFKIILFVTLILISRVAIGLLGGNASPHPPLNLLPTFLAGSLIGISDFSMKFSFLFVYTIFIYLYYRMLVKRFNSWQSILIVLSISSIPLLTQLSTSVEQSLWTSLIFTFILLDIITSNKINFIRLIAIGSIATMMRLPSFIVLVPIITMFIYSRISDKNFKCIFHELIYFSIPILFFLPFLVYQIFNGTASTDLTFINFGIFDRILYAFETNIFLISTLNAIDVWWIPFLFLAFIPISKSTIPKNLTFIVFFLICIIIYYSIKLVLWGEAKYQAEYIIPFIIAGFTFFMIRIKEFSGNKFFVILILLFFLTINLIKSSYYPSGNSPVDELVDNQYTKNKQLYTGYRGMLYYVYNYKDAYSYILNNQMEKHTLNLGVVYGLFPEIINNYTSQNIRSVNSIRNDYLKNKNLLLDSTGEGDIAELINSDIRIQNILLGFTFNKHEIISSLKKKNWKIVKEFKNDKYGSTIVVLKRN